MHAAIHGNSAAATCPQDHRKDNVLARARAVGRFGNRQAVSVIGAAHFAPQRAAQVLVEGLSVQPRGVGIFHQAGLSGNSPGNAQADGGAPSEFFLDFLCSLRYGPYRAVIVVPRRSDAVAMQFPAVSLERDEFDLGAAKIHADAKVFLFFLNCRHRWSFPGEEVVYTAAHLCKWLCS